MVLRCITVLTLVLSASKIEGYKNERADVHATSRSAFDSELYENVLDEALCEEQLVFLSNDSLRLPCKQNSFNCKFVSIFFFTIK